VSEAISVSITSFHLWTRVLFSGRVDVPVHIYREKIRHGPHLSLILLPPSTTRGRTASTPRLGRARQSCRMLGRPAASDAPPLLMPPAECYSCRSPLRAAGGRVAPCGGRISDNERREGADSLPAAGGQASTSRGLPLLLQS
jgi:hypothetical protein